MILTSWLKIFLCFIKLVVDYRPHLSIKKQFLEDKIIIIHNIDQGIIIRENKLDLLITK